MLDKISTASCSCQAERSAEIVIAADVSQNCVGVEFYDLALKRTYAKNTVFGGTFGAANASETLQKLVITAMREHNIPASAISAFGIAAENDAALALESELSPTDMFLSPALSFYFMPFISANIGGRFTASLMSIPEEEFLSADFGKKLCVAEKTKEGLRCACFELSGAFDASGIESGMPPERGAIDAVRRESGGVTAYEVIEDAESLGISPCGAFSAARLMLAEGIIDPDGIMSDRDLFYIGEDHFLSQSDIRVIQSDKARSAAAFEIFKPFGKTFLSGAPFSSAEGLNSLLAVGALPESLRNAAFTRNSVFRGIENCLSSENIREKAESLAVAAKDVTEEVLEDFDDKYIENLPFFK